MMDKGDLAALPSCHLFWDRHCLMTLSAQGKLPSESCVGTLAKAGETQTHAGTRLGIQALQIAVIPGASMRARESPVMRLRGRLPCKVCKHGLHDVVVIQAVEARQLEQCLCADTEFHSYHMQFNVTIYDCPSEQEH
jgi:hypothetical protein